MTIEELLGVLRRDQLRPPQPLPESDLPPMVFSCLLASQGVAEEELLGPRIASCCDDLKAFWKSARSARLFEDRTYGQWGLQILDPMEAVEETERFEEERPRDVSDGDLIIGRFIGDSSLLLTRCDVQAADYGAVIVVGAIDPRTDWDVVGGSFNQFLERYVAARGEMYWVHRPH